MNGLQWTLGVALALGACTPEPADMTPAASTTAAATTSGPGPGSTSSGGAMESTAADSTAETTSMGASTSSSTTATSSTTAAGESSTGVESTPFVVMTFNVRHGAESSLEAVAQVILDAEPDVVALQEVDQNTTRSGNVFQADVLGEMTEMEPAFFAAIPLQGGEYGLSVLSRHPIATSTQQDLTSVGEQRILAIADVMHPSGAVVTIANTHLGLTVAEREVQATEVIDALAGRPNVVLMGDLNAEPTESTFAALEDVFSDAYAGIGERPGFTFPATEPTIRIDYILLGTEWAPPTSAVVVDTLTSDHRPIVVELAL